MIDLERRLKDALTHRDTDAPAFEALFAAARQRAASGRRRRRAVLAAAAAASVAMLVVYLPTNPSPGLVSDEELLGTTSWSAPSDVLLPDRRTNIFYDLPALPESTGPVGETLL